MSKRRTASYKKRLDKRDKMRAARRAGMANPGGKSKYARKRAFLNRHGGMGTDYPHKPWK